MFGSTPIWSTVHDQIPRGGIDVYVDREFYTEPYRYEGWLGLIAIRQRTVRGALGWVTAQDCRSSSLQFLVSSNPPGEPAARGVRDSVLIGIHHGCNPIPPPLSRDQLPPAIQWRAAPISGSALTLTGCRFDNLTRVGPTRVSVTGMQTLGDQRPALFEYGTCSRDRLVVTWPPGAINNEDVFLATEPGRVPYG